MLIKVRLGGSAWHGSRRCVRIVLSTRFKLVNLEVMSRALLTSEQRFRNFRPFVGLLSEIKSFVGPIIIQLVWQIQISLGKSGGYLLPLR